ncbi:hypothetical protein FQN49_005832 [Arthroderma sp. PD_2]|nr:hypothetical protein FQN49_005832 [Arthroderma sp. PD_2]
MKASTVLCAIGLPLALSAPILLTDAVNNTPLPVVESQPCSALFLPYVTSSKGRQILIDCDAMLLEKYAYLAGRWSSFSSSSSTASLERDNSETKSPFLPNAAAEVQPAALKEQLDALPTPTSTSTSSTPPPSSISVSLPSPASVVAAYANRIRLEDIVANHDLPAFLDWLSARPIMAWALIVAVLIILFFVSAVIAEVAAAVRNAVTLSHARKQSQSPSGCDIYLSGPEKRLAAVLLIDAEEEGVFYREKR